MSAQRVPADSDVAKPVGVVTQAPRRGGAEPSLTRLALLPVGVLVAAIARFAFAAPFSVTALLTAPFVLLFAAAPWLARRALARFDRDSVLLLATDRKNELWPLYRASRALRLFVSPAELAARRGFMHAETDDPEAAAGAYFEALEGFRGSAPLSVMLGHAHACYASDQDEAAIAGYRGVLATGSGVPRVSLNLAHALLRTEQPATEALTVLEGVDPDGGTAEDQRKVRLMLALAHARAGSSRQADVWLERAGKPFGADEKALRREVLAAKGKKRCG